MKIETLKTLIQLEFKNCENMIQFRDRVLELIDIYENDRGITQMIAPSTPFTPVKGNEKVPFHTICGCNPEKGDSGICGCILANKLVQPNGTGYTTYSTTTETGLNYNYIKNSIDPND